MPDISTKHFMECYKFCSLLLYMYSIISFVVLICCTLNVQLVLLILNSKPAFFKIYVNSFVVPIRVLQRYTLHPTFFTKPMFIPELRCSLLKHFVTSMSIFLFFGGSKLCLNTCLVVLGLKNFIDYF